MNKDPQLVKRRTLIIGSGDAGSLLAEDILATVDTTFELVGFLDDNKSIKDIVAGLPVLGKTSELNAAAKKHEIEEVIIALPSVGGEFIRNLVDSSSETQLEYRVLPRSSEVLLQDYSEDFLQHIRLLRIEDLIGGNIDKSHLGKVTDRVTSNVFMITGAAGSIGSELSRQIALHGAQKIVFFDWWENGTFELRNELLEKFPNGNFEFVIGDIKDARRVDDVIKEHKPHTIFHAAAYKHVPLMEDNGTEAIKNNIIGTRTVAKSAIKNKVSKFVLVSSDKAVNPTNIMGATKRAAEKMVHVLSEGQDTTIFCSVRFGNVMNSNGSVIPIFKRQIEAGGPVCVTHKEINRYFMTIPEAVSLILKAWIIGENNDLFVLDMGEPIKIYSLAEWMISLKGFIPHKDIAIDVIGLRPGEKLYEEVLVEEEAVEKTTENSIFRTQNYMNFDKKKFLSNVEKVEKAISKSNLDRAEVHRHLKATISTFIPAKHSE